MVQPGTSVATRHPGALGHRAATLRALAGALAVCSLLLGTPAPAIAGGQPASPASLTVPSPPTGAEVEQWRDRLRDETLPVTDREQAATWLIRHAAHSHARTTLEDALVGITRENGQKPGRIVLRQLGREPLAPVSLWPSVRSLATTLSPDDLPLALAAAASFRTHEAAFLLLRHTEAHQSQAVRDAAFQGLRRLSGRPDLGRDTKLWQAWYLGVLELPERDWQRELLAGQAARADGLARDAAQTSARLIDVYRQLHLAMDSEQRPDLLASLLRDERDDLRRLGLDLVRRELAASNHPGRPVEEAAIDLLTHERSGARADGATLLNQLAPEGAAEHVVRALARETDQRAADAMLSTISRWPVPEAAEPVLAWLDRNEHPEPSLPAIDAAWSLHRAGVLDEDEHVPRVLNALRRLPDQRLTKTASRLLVEIGTHSDVQRLSDLLDSEDRAVRLAAGRALAEHPEFLDRLSREAMTDASLIDAALLAVNLHATGRDGFDRLAALYPAHPDRVLEAVLTFARDQPVTQVLDGAAVLTPAVRHAVLSALLERVESLQDPQSEPVFIVRLALAEAAMEALLPEDALHLLDSAHFSSGDAETVHRHRSLRTEALVMLGRTHEARANGGDAAAWMRAIRRSLHQDHIDTTSRRFEVYFKLELDHRIRAELDLIRRLAASRAQGEARGGADTRPSVRARTDDAGPDR